MDTARAGFVDAFGALVERVIQDFPHHYALQEGFRQRIMEEPAYFEANLKKVFLQDIRPAF